MAFATSNVRVSPNGGDSWMTTGSWTGGIGDAAGTVKVPGAQVISASFYPNLSSGGPVSSEINGTGSGTNPITVTMEPCNAVVTAGTFKIISR